MMPGDPIVGGVALRRPAIQSPNFVTGVSGWTINADGSAEFNNLKIRGTFLGSDFELSNNGFFLYNGVPGPGNIPIAGISAGTTDDYGNVFITGRMVTGGCMFFRNAAGAFAQLALFNGQPGLVNGTSDASEQHPAFHNTFVSGAGATRQEVTVVQSGDFDAGGVLNSLINLISASQDGTSTAPETKLVVGGATMLDIIGPIGVASGKLTFGGVPGQQMVWTDGNIQLNMPSVAGGGASSGPFISGEGFHTLTNPANYNGTARVKLLPWNAIWLDIELNGTVNTTGGVSLSLGALPSAAYYPILSRHFPMSMTGASLAATGSFLGTVRLHMPTSGNPAIEVPSLSTSSLITLALSVIYPSN